MKRKDRTVFLCDWYIIDAAQNWFGFGVSFNMISEIKAYYHKEMSKFVLGTHSEHSVEQIFETALLKFIEDFKEKQNE